MSNQRNMIGPPATGQSPWAICLSKADSAAMGLLWQVAGIEVCELADHNWLRGPSLDEDLHQRLRMMPGARRFYVLPDEQLQPVESLVPNGWLPQGPWVPLQRWLTVELPPASLAGQSEKRIALTLVRSTQVSDCTILMTTMDRWAAYVAVAPQVRLDRWRFAVAEDGRVVVRGQPLPPLAGQLWVEREGIAIPAGWNWSPPVEPAIVRDMFCLEPGDVALWHSDGTWQRIFEADFLPASRAAVRATRETINDAAS